MTGRRAVRQWDERLSRALQFVPGHVGGRVASAQPIRRRGGTLRQASVGAVSVEPTAYPASLMGYNSASPPYKIWAMEWNNNLPTDLAGTGFLRLTLAADLADSSFSVIVEGFTNLALLYVTVTGGPFTSGDIVDSPTFTVDMAGNDSSEADVLLPASVGFYTPYYDSVARTSGDFQTSAAALMML